MPLTHQQIQTAQAEQHLAAHESSPQVRVVAGPGTGKSFTIQERVRWLLDQGSQPDTIFVVSFTRASARDLRDGIHKYCLDHGQPAGSEVNVSTLHSLALRALRTADLLAYPTDPLVLDNWEMSNIHDSEFSSASGFRSGVAGTGYSLARAKLIREDYEAFCGTGQWQPSSYLPPDPAVSPPERQAYERFHSPRTQLYAYVLPGEIVRQCVDNMNAGTLDPASLLRIRHLVVDEYQDLNPSDLAFVDGLIERRVIVFVAGDDDQSLYSFRFAAPEGIQSFAARHPQVGDHQLSHCFRPTPNILVAAQTVIDAFSDPGRIPKRLSSLYTNAQPPERGIVHLWRFQSGVAEARCIAESCRELIAAGLPAREIMILLSNTRVLLPSITEALGDVDVPYQSPRAQSTLDTRPARFTFSLIRIACHRDDYVAHRLLLGLRPQVGPGTCNSIAEDAITNNLNFRDIFYQPLPTRLLRGRALTAVRNARVTCARISGWQGTDTIAQRSDELYAIVLGIFGQPEADQWQAEIAPLPADMTLFELRDYLWADNDEQRASLLRTIYDRLGLPVPPEGFLPAQVRIMTMHGVKGLSAAVVFIPGMERQILPGAHRQPYPGLVLEAARMLYVSITRARAACAISYAETRVTYGTHSTQTPSQFTRHLGGAFSRRSAPLDQQEVQLTMQSYANL